MYVRFASKENFAVFPQAVAGIRPRSLKIFLQSLLQYVLVRPPLGSSQRAEANVCGAINLESQCDGLLPPLLLARAAGRPEGSNLSGINMLRGVFLLLWRDARGSANSYQ